MDFDLVIQGPLNSTSLEYVDKVSSQFNKVIISHWSENDISLLDVIKSKNVEIYDQKTPDLNDTVGVLKDSTFFYSISSTFLGLQKCTSEYVIKMRSDERYENFDILKEKVLEHKDRFVFGNIFAKPWSHSKYHIGDHIFGCNKELLLLGYNILYDLYYTRKLSVSDNTWCKQGGKADATAENILALSFLKAKNVDIGIWDSIDTFKNNFDIVDIQGLGDYIVTWVGGHKSWSKGKKPFVWPVKTMENF